MLILINNNKTSERVKNIKIIKKEIALRRLEDGSP